MRVILVVFWDCHVTSSFLGRTELEVPAGHPKHGGAVGGESYRPETEREGRAGDTAGTVGSL